MSLLFDHAISGFDSEASELHLPADADLEETGEAIPVRPIVEFAETQSALDAADDGYTLLPLHAPDRAAPTGEHLLYGDHPLRGDIVVYADGDGGRSSVGLDAFARTALARRLRFWHSDYQPPELPPGYDRPVDDSEPPTRTLSPSTLTDRLADHVRSERAATRESNRETARTASPATLFEDGHDAVPSVRFEGTRGTHAEFRAVLPPSLEDARDGNWAYFVPEAFGIYEGNEVLVHGGDGSPLLEGTVENIHGLDLRVDIDWETATTPGEARTWLRRSPDAMGISQLLNPVPSDRELEAIDTLRTQAMCDVLAGQRPVTFTNGAAGRTDQLDAALNQSQAMAAELALLSDDVFCIHGPPGTGKTRTLIEIVRRAAAAGESVLVCADSNQAVDNVVAGDSTPDDPDENSLHPYAQHGTGELTLRRLNAGRSANDLVRSRYDSTHASADVVAATVNSAADLPDNGFDLVVVDEATQTTCTASCIPLTKGRRAVLAGDHRQLPPFSAHDEPPETAFGLSLFEHLYADGGVYEGVGIRLKTQYRMAPDIAYFPNREFYDRDLRAGRTVRPLPSRERVLEGFDVGGSVERVDHSYANPTEATLVAYLLRDLRTDVPPDDIGVITPYAAQVAAIREALSSDEEAPDPGAVTVDTVDSFQGSEREAVVISLVRSNADGRLGFLGRHPDGPRRLNVALTRARRYCAVVGDFQTVRYEHDAKDNDLYSAFYRHFDETGRLRGVDADLLEAAV